MKPILKALFAPVLKPLFLLTLLLHLLILPSLAQTGPDDAPPPSPQASASPSPAPQALPSATPKPARTPRPSPSPEPTPSPEPSASPASLLPDEKNPWLAAGLSLLVPGLGQMYVEEQFWPEILITAGMALAVVAFVIIDQQRAGSIRPRVVNQQPARPIADAHWDALTLVFQIAIPSLWLWNAGDAYKRAEMFEEKVMGELDTRANPYIIEENLVSVTLWQF